MPAITALGKWGRRIMNSRSPWNIEGDHVSEKQEKLSMGELPKADNFSQGGA
jgi:hypothetical protein